MQGTPPSSTTKRTDQRFFLVEAAHGGCPPKDFSFELPMGAKTLHMEVAESTGTFLESVLTGNPTIWDPSSRPPIFVNPHAVYTWALNRPKGFL